MRPEYPQDLFEEEAKALLSGYDMKSRLRDEVVTPRVLARSLDHCIRSMRRKASESENERVRSLDEDSIPEVLNPFEHELAKLLIKYRIGHALDRSVWSICWDIINILDSQWRDSIVGRNKRGE